MGYWPATPNNITTVFDQEVFEFWDILQKLSPGVSQRSFLMSLQEFSLNKGRVGIQLMLYASHCIKCFGFTYSVSIVSANIHYTESNIFVIHHGVQCVNFFGL